MSHFAVYATIYYMENEAPISAMKYFPVRISKRDGRIKNVESIMHVVET